MQLLDPRISIKLTEGFVDVIAKETAEDARFLSALRCPKCRSPTITKEVDSTRPFSARRVTVNWNGRCADCKCLFSPNSRIIISE